MIKNVTIGSLILLTAIMIASCEKLGSNPFKTISGVFEISRGQLTKLDPPPQQYISDNDAYEETFFGVTVVVVGKGHNSITDPDFLKTVDTLQGTIEKHHNEVKETVSVVDYVSKIHQEFNPSQKNLVSIPDNKTLIGQLLFLFENEDGETLENLINPEHSEAMIYIKKRTTDISNGFVDTIVEEVKRFSENNELTITTKLPPETLTPLERIRVSNGILFIDP